MPFNLTPNQMDLLREIVECIRAQVMPEEFMVIYTLGGTSVSEAEQHQWKNEITKGKLDALEANGLIQVDRRKYNDNVSLLGAAYAAVDNNFAAPDTSFLTQLTPLADITNLDPQLKARVLPILGAGAADPVLWDSAVRTASVILEERLRDVGSITDGSFGKDLVNKVFGKTGVLAPKFTEDSERESYRDLYAGVTGLIRNPSAHRLIDPKPEEGGVSIVLVNLLLSKLESLR